MYSSSSLRSFFFYSSVIYKVDSSGILSIHQQFLTKGARSVTSFHLGGEPYLVVVHLRDNQGQYRQGATLYVWNPAERRFAAVQRIEGVECQIAHAWHWEEEGKLHVAVVPVLRRTCTLSRAN